MALPDNILLSSNLRQLEKRLQGREAYAILDGNVREPRLTALFRPESILRIEAGEAAKRMTAVEALAGKLLNAGADRNALLVGIGGGTTTDLTGLLAALYMRGVACALVPTTLLAQVDAAIGGKNGVNLEGYKNMLGTFRQPEFIYICPPLAESADDRGGIAEMLKTFLLCDPAAYARAVVHFSAPEPRCAAERLSLIRRAVEIKSAIVAEDFLDRDARHRLNLGHTFGHAIEKCTAGAVSHGDAVAMGIILAAGTAVQLGKADPALVERLKRDFTACGLPVECPVAREALLEAISKDKKKSDGALRFILPVAVGRVVVQPLKPEEVR